jgi:hypothetical protein
MWKLEVLKGMMMVTGMGLQIGYLWVIYKQLLDHGGLLEVLYQ